MMKKRRWSTPTSSGKAARRAGGRRRHNAERKREMWERRFAILRILALDDDLPHGGQRLLAERFGVSKSVISRDVAWARKNGLLGCGFTPRCSYGRGTVTITWVNTRVNNILRVARRWLKEAERAGATR
jgi:hypothetical protein